MPLNRRNAHPKPSGAIMNVTNGINVMGSRRHSLSNGISKQFYFPGS
jgi:hypothetical protein